MIKNLIALCFFPVSLSVSSLSHYLSHFNAAQDLSVLDFAQSDERGQRGRCGGRRDSNIVDVCGVGDFDVADGNIRCRLGRVLLHLSPLWLLLTTRARRQESVKRRSGARKGGAAGKRRFFSLPSKGIQSEASGRGRERERKSLHEQLGLRSKNFFPLFSSAKSFLLSLSPTKIANERDHARTL
jgi:hypothetical protein